MTEKFENTAKRLINYFGYEIHRANINDFSKEENEIIKYVTPFTYTSSERILALIESVKYVIKNNIPGSIVECGVWRGGSMMAVAKVLLQLNKTEKDLYLYDTFTGMTKPQQIDVSSDGLNASSRFEKSKISDDSSDWSRVDLSQVQKNLFKTGYNKEKFHFIKGKVEDTLPTKAPEEISILRLDTDWYESTKHELIHLFPRLTIGGVLILDDYGVWQGARKAVDEYLSENKIKILLNRIDEAGRVGIKIEHV